MLLEHANPLEWRKLRLSELYRREKTLNYLDNMKVSSRLGLAFCTLIALIILIAAIALISIKKLNGITDNLTRDRYRKVVILNSINNDINLAARAMRNIALSKDAATKLKEEARLNEADEKTVKALRELEPMVKQEEGKRLLAELKAAHSNYLEARKPIFSMFRQGKWDDATKYLITDFRKVQNAYFDAVDKFLGRMDDAFKRGAEGADKTGNTSIILIVTLGLSSIVAGILAAWTVSRSLLTQIGGEPVVIANIAEQIAAGNLSVNLNTKCSRETGIYVAVKHMVESLREIVSQTIDISSGIAAASEQLHLTAEQIASGVEEVMAQSSTVATSSEEMSATSLDIARNCTIAAEASQQSAQAADEGAKVVQETIKGMGVIADHVRQTATTIENLGARSEQIGNIVGTIEDIADQTNLLALNAAIEAARAGEQGRGFAVVADEVRALAERTTRATKEISGMIKAIQQDTRTAVSAMEEGVLEVEKGAETSQRSGQALEEILNRINEVSMQVSQIATAAEEQTATTNEVTSNILQITDVMQQTNRGSDETAEAAAQLESRAHELQNLVSRFRVS